MEWDARSSSSLMSSLAAFWLSFGCSSAWHTPRMTPCWHASDLLRHKKRVHRWRWKVKLILGSSQHHTMMAYRESRHIATLILNLSTRLSWAAALSISCVMTFDMNCMKMATCNGQNRLQWRIRCNNRAAVWTVYFTDSTLL
jgi:hypothetical protein